MLKVFKTEGKKYTVQGFRKGKAPRHLIERMYGPDVFTYDAINNLFRLSSRLPSRLPASRLWAVPRLPLILPAMTRAHPDRQGRRQARSQAGRLFGLTVEKTVHTVQESAVDAELKRVQERNARELTREGAAQNGDIVDIDFEGFVDGVAFEGGKAEHYSLTLGSGSFIPGFEDQSWATPPAMSST